MSVTGNQVGTATFEVYRNWTLKNGVFTGSNPQEFTVAPRAGGDPATTFSATGQVIVDSTQAQGTYNLTIGVFDITNSNATGAKLAAGSSASYSVTVHHISYDTIPPEITAPSDMIVEATGPSGAVVTFSATAVDNVDGPVMVNAAPASGSTFPLGITTVTLTATDIGGNTATKTFLVTVVDTTAPVITAPNDITTEATGPSGAVVNFSASATDLVDGDVMVTADPASGSTFALGETTVTLTATDAANNKATKTFKVTVVDTTAPDLTVPQNLTVYATSAAGALVNYDPATAVDIVDQDVEISYSQNSGTWFPIGTTTVNVTATDDYNNVATGSFTVTVKYDFNGFFQPVDMDKLNIAKAGSAIPIKFSLGGDMGLDIFKAGYPKAITIIIQDTVVLTDTIETTVTAGGSQLTYDPIAKQYIYVWKTETSWAGSSKRLVVILKDGTEHFADFQFKK